MDTCRRSLSVLYFHVFVYIFQASSENKTFVWYVSSNQTWEAAQTQCRNRNGTLVQITQDNLEDITDCVMERGDPVWTGAYTVNKGEWIEFIGCYDNMLIKNIQNHSILLNSPEQCRLYCKGHKMFALMGDFCFCMNESTTMSDFELKGAHSCSYKCKGNLKRYCGGNGSVNAYSISVKTNSGQSFDCVTSKCKDVNGCFSCQYSASQCNAVKRFICGNGLQGTSNPEGSENECLRNDSYLWGPSILDCNHSMINVTGDEFWTNIFRSYVIKWDFESDPADAIVSYSDKKMDILNTQDNLMKMCYTIRLLNSRISINEEECAKEYSFLCQTDFIFQETQRKTDIRCLSNSANQTQFEEERESTEDMYNETKYVNPDKRYGVNTRGNLGMIVGVSVAVVTILVVIVIVAVICMARRSSVHHKQRQQPSIDDNVLNRQHYTIDNYELPTCSLGNTPTPGVNKDKGESGDSNIKKLSRNYEFATIRETDMEGDVYTKSLPGEYDILGKASLRHIDNVHNNNQFDVTYSHTMATEEKDNPYDRIGEKKKDIDPSDSYSHVPITGNFGPTETAYDTTGQSSPPKTDVTESYSHIQIDRDDGK